MLLFLIIGGAICGSFILFGGISVLLYRPWRRYVNGKRVERAAGDASIILPIEDEEDPEAVVQPKSDAPPHAQPGYGAKAGADQVRVVREEAEGRQAEDR